MRRNLSVILSAGLGAGLMYLLDPRFGRRRRSLLRDQAVHAAHKTRAAADSTRRDLSNRMQGVRAGLNALQHRDQSVSDEVLAERVRSRLGRYCSHPSAVDVYVQDGKVTLSGPILAEEVDRLIRSVVRVRGVRREVENRLKAYTTPGKLPALQGGHPAPGQRFELLQANWSPTARLLAGAAGAAGTAYGLARRGPLGGVIGLAGVTALTRAVTNLDLARMVGGADIGAVDVQKTIHILAPAERVFDLWSNYENLPHFMSHVKSVQRVDGDRWRWTVTGPGGAPVEWEAVTIQYRPNERIAWRTVPGSTVEHEGSAYFSSEADDSTRVQVHLRYRPPGGRVGHAFAAWLGADPKQQMDEDLARMKNFIERGMAEREAVPRSGG